MPIYDYLCENCEKWHAVVQPMSGEHQEYPCDECGRVAKRVIVCPQIQAMPERCKSENTNPFGMSDTDSNAMRKADDKRYEQAWHGKNPHKPKAQSLTDLHHKMHGPTS